MKLTTQQKWEAISALNEQAYLERKKDGKYFVHPYVEIGGDGFLRSICGFGKTEKQAIDEVWDSLTLIPENYYIAVGGYSEKRRNYRWNGFMWKEV